MKKFTIAAFCLLLGLLLGFNISGKGQILLEENFDYTAGDLITAHGWTAHSGGGTNPITITSSTLTYPGYVSSGTGNEVTLTTSGEDDNHTFVSQTSGTIYASFLVKITSASTTGDYFFHLGPSPISTIFVARFFAKRDASNNLAFGISQTNGAANYTGFAYSLNTTYLVIIKYTINSGSGNDAVSVFINPTLGASEPSPTVSNTDTPNDPVNIGAVALRQGSSSNAPGLKLDGIRIGQSWSDVASLAIVAPTLQASNISFGSITTSGMNVNWTNGDGSKRIVIMNTSNSFTNPVDGNDPSANTVYNGSGEQVIYNGSSNSVAVTGLNSNTTYWYRIFECNGTGTNTKYLTSTATGNPNSQASAGSPAAVTNAATALTTTSATLNGIVNAHGLSTTVNFDWGLTTAYGNNITAAESPVSGFADSPVTAAVSGLTPNTLYHFRVVGSNSAGTNYGSDMTFTTICPIPAAAGTITGPANVCKGSGGYVYHVDAISNASGYVWSVPAGATITAGNNTTDITVSFSASAVSGNISVYGNSVCGNGTSSSYAVIVNAPPSAPAISGPSSACAGSAGNVYSTTAGFTGYTWVVSAGGTITAGGGTLNNYVTVTWNTTGSRSVSVNYNNAAGCNSGTTSFPVTINSLPSPTITGNALICAGTTGVTYTTETGMSGYSWSVSPGGQITGGSGTSSITVTWNTAGSQTVSVNYANASGCTASVPTVFNVTVNPIPAPSITGPATICSPASGNIYSTQAGFSNYTWNVSAGGLINSGSGTDSITVTWNTAGAKTVTVNYSNTSNCSAPSPAIFNVTVNARPAPTITGVTSLCANTGYYNYTTEPGMNNYQWTVSNGGTITYGAGTSTIQVDWTNGGSQWVRVNYTNAAGCTAIEPTQLNVTVNTVPANAGVITGPSSVCAGSQNVAFSVSPVSGAITYLWTIPQGASIVSGDGTNSILVDFSTAASSGNISVLGNNLCGNGNPSPSFPLNIVVLPGNIGPVTGQAAVCKGATDIPYSVTPVAYVENYIWNLPAGASIQTGANTNSITVIFDNNAVSGDITVYGTNACGAGGVSPALAVTVNPIPPTPVITQHNDTLVSSEATGNQWYFEGVPINGATGQTYVVGQTGNYYTVVTLNGCSSAPSNTLYMIIEGIGNPLQSNGIRICPNPSDGHFTVDMTTSFPGNYNLTVYNSTGSSVYSKNGWNSTGHNQVLIDLQSLSNGIYTVVIRTGNHQTVNRLIIVK